MVGHSPPPENVIRPGGEDVHRRYTDGNDNSVFLFLSLYVETHKYPVSNSGRLHPGVHMSLKRTNRLE